MPKLVVVRHGQSLWNKENRFTGWIDIDLSEQGVDEAHKAGEKLKHFRFDAAFTSNLLRAKRTLQIILEEIEQTDIPVQKNVGLNERMFGDLQGKNKDEMLEEFGEEQLHVWRRSYNVAPPNGESLKDTADRVVPYFEQQVAPLLKEGRDILISAHGNSLRALIMYLEEMTGEEIVKVEIPTGVPRLYNLDRDIKVLKADYI